MAVRPAYRRNGLGGALFGQAVDLARTIGYSRLLLESPRSWAGAHAVYTRHGFAPVDAYPESEVPPTSSSTGSTWAGTCSRPG